MVWNGTCHDSPMSSSVQGRPKNMYRNSHYVAVTEFAEGSSSSSFSSSNYSQQQQREGNVSFNDKLGHWQESCSRNNHGVARYRGSGAPHQWQQQSTVAENTGHRDQNQQEKYTTAGGALQTQQNTVNHHPATASWGCDTRTDRWLPKDGNKSPKPNPQFFRKQQQQRNRDYGNFQSIRFTEDFPKPGKFGGKSHREQKTYRLKKASDNCTVNNGFSEVASGRSAAAEDWNHGTQNWDSRRTRMKDESSGSADSGKQSLVSSSSSSSSWHGQGRQWKNRGNLSSKRPQCRNSKSLSEPLDMNIDMDKAASNRCVSDSESDIIDEESDEDCASDGSAASHETQKKNKLFEPFFKEFDALPLKEIDYKDWHCPVCRGGVGAIDWYRGMQPLLSHAKTVRSKRVKLHRQFADVLEEELKRRGAASVKEDEMFGKWTGLGEGSRNHDRIVWPPMVVIPSIFLDSAEKEKWRQMGADKLYRIFKDYNIKDIRIADGPQPNKVTSILIFEGSAMGYFEAEYLHQHFAAQGRDRKAFECSNMVYHPGVKALQYGYLARKQDLDDFNKNSTGKSKVKYELKLYQSMVVDPWRKLDKDKHKVIWYKNKIVEEKHRGKILKEAFSTEASNLRMREDEIQIIRQRALELHEEHKKQMESLEKYYKDEIARLSNQIMIKEDAYDEMLENFKNRTIKRCNQLEMDSTQLLQDTESGKGEKEGKQVCINEEIIKQTQIIDVSFKNSEEYEQKRQELIKIHDERRKQVKLRQLQEEVDFEKKAENERLQILEKYIERHETYKK